MSSHLFRRTVLIPPCILYLTSCLLPLASYIFGRARGHRPYTLITFERPITSCTPFVFLCL